MSKKHTTPIWDLRYKVLDMLENKVDTDDMFDFITANSPVTNPDRYYNSRFVSKVLNKNCKIFKAYYIKMDDIERYGWNLPYRIKILDAKNKTNEIIMVIYEYIKSYLRYAGINQVINGMAKYFENFLPGEGKQLLEKYRPELDKLMILM